MIKTRFIIIVVSISFLNLSYLHCQLTKNKEKLNNWNEQFDAGLPKISIAALPTYSPDNDLALSTAAIISFKTRRNNNYLSHSYFPIHAITNFYNKHSASALLNSYWLDDLLLFNAEASYHNRIDNYYSVGMDKASEIEKGTQSTQYHKQWLTIKPSLNFNLFKNIFAGVIYDYNAIIASNLAPLLYEDPYIIKQGTNIKNAGLGLNFCLKPNTSGEEKKQDIAITLQGLYYSNSIGSDYDYQKILFTYHHSIKLKHISGKIIWHIHTHNTFKDSPWSDMAFLGGEQRIIGLAQGKYRDKSLIHFFIEYEYLFRNNNSKQQSRHAVVMHFGGGTVYGLSKENAVITNVAFGYRFLYQPNTRLKLNIGFADNSFGSYLGFVRMF